MRRVREREREREREQAKTKTCFFSFQFVDFVFFLTYGTHFLKEKRNAEKKRTEEDTA